MRTWLITGASRGLGAEIARGALARGDAVVATGRDPAKVLASVGAHPNLLAACLDVTDEAQAKTVVAQAVARFGGVDILVNNAGIGLLGAIEETSAAEAEHLFRTNVFGLLHVTRAVLPQMRARGRGHVINVSSLGGYSATAGWGVYCASKGAVEGLTEALWREMTPLGIHVTVVEPAYFRSDFLNDSLVHSEARIDAYAGTVGLARSLVAQGGGEEPPDSGAAAVARCIVALADEPNPPLRLPLGPSALKRIAEKHAHVHEEVERWAPFWDQHRRP